MNNPFSPGYYGSEELREFGFAAIGENVRVARDCVIVGLENIRIGDHCRIDSGTRLLVASGHIHIGDYVHIHTGCMIGGRGGVEIGDFSSLSHDVCIVSASDDFSGRSMFASVVPEQFTNPKIAPVVIGRHCPLGMQSAILPGVTIGDGAGIGVQTMVRKSLEPWTIYHGNPARRIGERKRASLAMEEAIRSAAARGVAA